MLQRFSKNCWWPLVAFSLKILDVVSSSGSGTWATASSHRGSTLKGPKISNLYDYLNNFF